MNICLSLDSVMQRSGIISAMASSKDDDKCNYFHRTIELHLDYGSETLRQVIEKKLKSMNSSTLGDHLNKRRVHNKLHQSFQDGFLHPEQWDLLYPRQNRKPELARFDITLLTYILLETNMGLSNDERKTISKLRCKRNKMSHLPKSELPDKTNFNETSELIIGLSKIVGQAFTKQIKENIQALNRKEFVSTRGNLEIVKIRNEELLVKLTESSGKQTADCSNTTMLRFGLTKWAKQFSKNIDLETFLSLLKDKRVLSQTEKMNIENQYNKEEQSSKLIMKMMDETNENLFQFRSCLRKLDENLANLIENNNTDGADTEAKLKAAERDKLSTIINNNFKIDNTGSVQCEEVHVIVEDELGYSVDYITIEQIFLEIFKPDKAKAGDYRFHGIVARNTAAELRKKASCFKNATGSKLDKDGENISDISSDKLAQYVWERVEQIDPKYGATIKEAFEEQCITPKQFIEMPHADVKECFGSYSEKGIPYGVILKLKVLQGELKSTQTETDLSIFDPLRKFDTPTDKLVYQNCHLRPAIGNLLVPAHEFRMLPQSEEFTNLYIVKECIKFIAACMNSRKNGTIHFGIMPMGNGCGSICGIRKETNEQKIWYDCDITKAIEKCFHQKQVPYVKRCVRPFQAVPVENESIVLEMDVVPFSGYSDSDPFLVLFPPHGKQDEKFFVYREGNECEIVTVPDVSKAETLQLYKRIWKERISLEGKSKQRLNSQNDLASQLKNVLTAGSDYVTDQYTPIICCGKITGCERESDIRKTIDMTEVFLASAAVFDFDSSVCLRTEIEKQNKMFRVLTADRNFNKDGDFTGSDKIWMYCNGNMDLRIDAMDLKDWYRDRFHIVKDAISLCKQKTPRHRAIVLFFAFDRADEKDPLLYLAEDCIKSEFRDQCVVIADSDETISELKKRLFEIIPSDDLVNHFHTGLKWEEISLIMKTIFRSATQYDYKLPCSDGHFVIMTAEEKRQMNFTDIEILSGEECKREEMFDNDDDVRRKRKRKEQENFYRGRDVSWWNFYYGDQVGKRDLHFKYLQSVETKLQAKGEKLIETVKIRHQPGAGGSTAGKYLLWNLSQFDHSRGTKQAYRCCVIKQITENTALQIYEFLSFKDKTPKPVIILTDNENEENLRSLRIKLDQQAYKSGEANKLFCLHIDICRVSVSYKKPPDDLVLKHELSNEEKSWFETKYKELEDSEIDVTTLISFNVMRKNFDKKYIKELADTILKDVTNTEINVLKGLSLVNRFDSDNAIPINTFDCLVTNQGKVPRQLDIWGSRNRGPFGLVTPMFGYKSNIKARDIWNADLTDEFCLLTKKVYDNYCQCGIMIISQALSEAILDYIMRKQHLSLNDVILFLLKIAKNHVKETNSMSKHLIKIINGLFKTRQLLNNKGEVKTKFSDMVMELECKQSGENESDATDRVVNVMQQCFEITSDAMVGQQLARFLLHMKEFERAETVILESLELQPNSSYLLDTYGQIYRSKMENLITEKEKEAPIDDEDAAQIISIAFMAIDKFVQGQDCSVSSMDIDGGAINNNCFYMEVKTLLILLENFHKFACYDNRDNFHVFLNQTNQTVAKSTIYELASRCPVKDLQKDSEKQMHFGETLRYLEEQEYQIKSRSYTIYTVYTETAEKLMLNLRERYENFYGTVEERSKMKFLYGVGLKSLMQANEDKADKFEARVREANLNLQDCDRKGKLKTADKRDLLILLGSEIIQMSKQGEKDSQPMNVQDYQLLLRYSERLLEVERVSKRPYLEAFLYYAMLQWPSPSRLGIEKLGIESFCKPKKYANMLQDWKTAFDGNFKDKTARGYRNNKPKNYFFLGKGDLGLDIVDSECIRKEWTTLKQTTEQRMKPPVKADKIWKEEFVVDRLQRLIGIMDDSGKKIQYKDKNDIWSYDFTIRTYDPCPHLCNRLVTFVLGFTWAGLAAFDVEDKERTPKKDVSDSGKTSQYRLNKTIKHGPAEDTAKDEPGNQCFRPDDLTRALKESTTGKEISETWKRLILNCTLHDLEFRGETPGNGNCFFEAIACQLNRLGLQNTAPALLRSLVTEYIRQNPVFVGPDGNVSLADFVEGSLKRYCKSMSRDGTFADHVVVIAMARMLKHDIHIVTSSPSANAGESLTRVIGENNFKGNPMLLGHVWENHYQSLQPKEPAMSKERFASATKPAVEIPDMKENEPAMLKEYCPSTKKTPVKVPNEKENEPATLRERLPETEKTQTELHNEKQNDTAMSAECFPGARKTPLEVLNEKKKGLQYNMISEAESGNKGQVTVRLEVDGHTIQGKGRTKQIAKQQAAKTALLEIYNIQCSFDDPGVKFAQEDVKKSQQSKKAKKKQR